MAKSIEASLFHEQPYISFFSSTIKHFCSIQLTKNGKILGCSHSHVNN